MGKAPLPGLRISIALIMLFQLSALLLRGFVELRLAHAGLDRGLAKNLAALAGFGMLAVFLAPLLWPVARRTTVLFQRPQSWPPLIVTAISIGILVRLASWSWTIATASPGLAQSGDPALGTFFRWNCPASATLLPGLFVMAVVTPWVEEYINRGLILCRLLARGRSVAIVGSAALFALAHPAHGIPMAFVFGVLAGLQLMHCRTLWGPVLAHASYNALAVLDGECVHWVLAALPGPLPAALAGGLLLLVAAILACRPAPGPQRVPAQPHGTVAGTVTRTSQPARSRARSPSPGPRKN